MENEYQLTAYCIECDTLVWRKI